MSCAPGGRLGAGLRQRLVPEVVVVEVGRRERPHRRGELEHAIGVRVAGWPCLSVAIRGFDERGDVGPVVGLVDRPAGVVEAHQRGVQPRGIESRVARHTGRELERALAQRDRGDGRVVRDGLRHDVHGVGVVHERRARCQPLDVGHHALHHPDRPERHEESAGALRLLADDAMAERDPLVEHAGLEAPGPEAGEDDIGVSDALGALGGGHHAQVDIGRLGHPEPDALDDLQPLRVEVDEHDLRAAELGPSLDDGGHGAGGTGAAPADVGESDRRHGPRWVAGPVRLAYRTAPGARLERHRRDVLVARPTPGARSMRCRRARRTTP